MKKEKNLLEPPIFMWRRRGFKNFKKRSMLKYKTHDFKIFLRILLPILNSDLEKFSKAIKQAKKFNAVFEVISPYTGFAAIPLHFDVNNNDNFQILSNIHILNQKNQTKELILYFADAYLSGFEIKENLQNLKVDSLNFSNMLFKKQFTNKYFVREIDLEGITDEIPGLKEYIDPEYLSEEYIIDGKAFFRTIQFDDIRCICIDESDNVFKVNLKNGASEKLFNSLAKLYQEFERNESYIYNLFGEYNYTLS